MTKKSVEERLDEVLKGATCFGAVPEEAVQEAEAQLGVSFPISYRLFLKRFGASLFVGPYEVYGLATNDSSSEEPPLYTNVVLANRQMSRQHQDGFLEKRIIICDDGSETFFFLNLREITDSECAVGSVEPGRVNEVVAKDFIHLLDILKAACGRGDGA